MYNGSFNGFILYILTHAYLGFSGRDWHYLLECFILAVWNRSKPKAWNLNIMNARMRWNSDRFEIDLNECDQSYDVNWPLILFQVVGRSWSLHFWGTFGTPKLKLSMQLKLSCTVSKKILITNACTISDGRSRLRFVRAWAFPFFHQTGCNYYQLYTVIHRTRR